MSTVDEIKAALEKLPAEHVREIADWISNRHLPDPEIDPDWAADIQSLARARELDSGQVQPKSHDEVFRNARAALG